MESQFLEIEPDGVTKRVLGVPVAVSKPEGAGEQADEKNGEGKGTLETYPLFPG